MTIAVDQHLARATAFLGEIAGAAERATARALNKAAVAGREAAVSAVVERYAVNASDIRERISLSTATAERLGVAVVARSGALSLGYFPHSPIDIGTGGPGKANLTVEVLRGQPRDVPDAFIARINGKPRIMARTGGTTKTGRTQLKSLYTVPFASMLGASSVQDAVEDRAAAVLSDRLEQEIDRELGKNT